MRVFLSLDGIKCTRISRFCPLPLHRVTYKTGFHVVPNGSWFSRTMFLVIRWLFIYATSNCSFSYFDTRDLCVIENTTKLNSKKRKISKDTSHISRSLSLFLSTLRKYRASSSAGRKRTLSFQNKENSILHEVSHQRNLIQFCIEMTPTDLIYFPCLQFSLFKQKIFTVEFSCNDIRKWNKGFLWDTTMRKNFHLVHRTDSSLTVCTRICIWTWTWANATVANEKPLNQTTKDYAKDIE